MTTKATEKTSLEIKRFINAPRNRVYQAWTDPVQMKEWWGPDNVRTLKIVADTRIGGKYRWDLVNPEGEQMSVFGEYRELIPGRKIVFTWKWDDDEDWQNYTSLVSVEFSDRDGGTELRLTHEQLPSEESRDRHNQGWNSVLDRLERFCMK
ncbi:MAG TPA: SRPBCC domain-containing protein [Chthoniobacterales bacterium]|nr:SRPBCC domain-containing protein [Chthoniobacterales bacterium]